MISSNFVQILVPFLLIGYIESLDICGDWYQYKDTKCIKVLRTKVNETDASRTCAAYDRDSTLITINSRDEQLFLENLFVKFEDISNSAWIGLKYLYNSYNWLDGTNIKYTNWAKDAVKDGTDPCVQMSLGKIDFGKWIDVSCKKTALPVCQKKQVFSLNTLRIAFETLENETKTELASLKMSASVPLGFLYTQLPNQTSPEQLWPNTNWTDVTHEYAGLFFRAEGLQSLPFGQIQSANQSWISNRKYVNFHEKRAVTYPYATASYVDSEVKGKWNSLSGTYDQKTQGTSFYTTEGEVRPRNTAILIWKRTG